MSDITRKFDLLELAEKIKNSTSTSEREYYEKIAYIIINESTEVGVLRGDLIKAMRANDQRAIRMIRRRIQERKLEETNGGSWGSHKTNRRVLN